MADEVKDPGGISNGSIDPNAVRAPQPQTTPDPEVRILEEHVTRAAQKPASSDPATPPAPSMPKAAPSAVPVPIPPAPAPAAPRVNSPPPLPPPTTGPNPIIVEDVGLVLPPKSPPIPISPSAPTIPTAPKTTPTPVQAMPSPTSQSAPASLATQGGPALGDDIAKILSDVKLPERRTTSDAASPNLDGQRKIETSIVGSPMHESNKPATSPEEAPSLVTPKDAEKTSVTPVHTLKDDLQGAVQDQKMSLVRAVSLEENRRAHKTSASLETPATKQRSNRTFGIIFAILILFGLGAAALFGVSFVMNQQQSPLQTDSGSSILFAEQSVLLSIESQSPGDLKRTIEAGRTASQGTLGSIVRIIPVLPVPHPDGTTENRAATFKEFIAAIGAHPPDNLLRALGNDFFFGIHAVDESGPLLVVPVTSHDQAFEAMLNWEENLNGDLAPIFTAVPVLKQDQNGLPIKRTYEDLVMRNYDVRALKDDTGAIQLYYSFPTQNILVIAESPYSFPEILSRLQAGRQL